MLPGAHAIPACFNEESPSTKTGSLTWLEKTFLLVYFFLIHSTSAHKVTQIFQCILKKKPNFLTPVRVTVQTTHLDDPEACGSDHMMGLK